MVSRLVARIALAGLPPSIHATTTAYLVLGLGALLAAGWTGNQLWVERYFGGFGALALFSLAAAEFLLGLRVARCFSPGEPLHCAWLWIAISAGFNCAGAAAAQLLSAASAVNPLTWFAQTQGALALNWRQLGLTLAGPCRFFLLAGGLHCVLKAYRRSGLIGRLAWPDRVLLAALAGYVIYEFVDLGRALAAGRPVSLAEALNWPVDPLLWLLFRQAMLIRHSVQRTGLGWVGRVWAAYAAGVALTVVGDVVGFLFRSGYLDWTGNIIAWYIWIPAAGAFALGPAYQWEAIRLASGAPARSGTAPQSAL